MGDGEEGCCGASVEAVEGAEGAMGAESAMGAEVSVEAEVSVVAEGAEDAGTDTGVGCVGSGVLDSVEVDVSGRCLLDFRFFFGGSAVSNWAA